MSVNKVILVGNVGKDPEVRYLDKNVAVASFSLATSERGYTTQTGTQVPERTEWHNIVVWRSLAEFAEKYIKKGNQLYVEGKIQNRSWEKDGVKRSSVDIVADHIQFIGRREKPEDAAQQQTTAAVKEEKPIISEPPVTDDDLPF